MTPASDFEIFLAVAPGLEAVLAREATEKGFTSPVPLPGGVTVSGGWQEVWRANLELRSATRVLARIASFRVAHLAQLDKRARRVPWAEFLRRDVPVAVEASTKRSRIYHAGAAAERVATAIAEEFGAAISPEAAVRLVVRIEDDLCTLSIDTSGESLHKRGHKEAVNRAPMRETMAAAFLLECGYRGNEPVFDPMCGSGTFVLEAAEMGLGLLPGRSRSFAFEQLPSFDAVAWQHMLGAAPPPRVPAWRYQGSDRDAGAIDMSRANAERAGLTDVTDFAVARISEIARPAGPPGLVIANPPYGTRLGDAKKLAPLYSALGQVLRERFAGWRVGIITTEVAFARAMRLSFLPSGPPVLHGGLRVKLFRTEAL